MISLFSPAARLSFRPLSVTFLLWLITSTALSAREPSFLEQYYLELVNRARANPNQEVTRLSGETWGDDGSPVAANLNEGLAPGTISATAKPPLAFDPRLIDAASNYSDLLLANEAFTHTYGGTTPTDRMSSAGYTFVPSSGSGENLALTTSTAANPVNSARVEEHHMNLFIDGNVPGRGHRISIMSAEFREVGMSIRADSDAQSYFGMPFTSDVLSTQNFAYSQGRVFVTGVIYADGNANSFYEPGESSGILTLQVKNTGGSVLASGTSFGSGGYSINLFGVASGSYTLVARDSAGDEESTAFVWNGSTNVKADIVNPAFTAPPVLGINFQPDGHIGTSEFSQIGNEIHSDSGAGQTIRATTKSKRVVIWHATFENDGIGQDEIRISGGRSNRFFRISYFRKSGGSLVNATGDIGAGTGTTLQSGEKNQYVIRIKPEKKALGRRNKANLFLRGVSVNDPSKSDRVKGTLLNRTRR